MHTKMTAEGSQIKLLDLNGSNGIDYDSMDVPTTPGGTPAPKRFLEIEVLGENEQVMLQLAADDDLEGLQEHLEDYPDTNINVTDYLGHSALQHAVENQNEAMVQFLLTQPNIKLRDSQLFAVRENHASILTMLLDWEERQKREFNYFEPIFESAEFPPHMTPLMLACIENAHQLAVLLIQRGHDIIIPSDDEYKDTAYADYGETLELGLARIDSYRAISSPTYICLKREDPILSAFKISHEAENLAFEDPIFKDEYLKIAKQSSEFAVGLLDQCRTSEDVWVLLKQNHDQDLFGVKSGGQYPRLQLAMEYEQKEFVTHSNCQQVLQNLWTQNHAELLSMGPIQGMLYFIPRIMILPFIYILYIFSPCLPIYKDFQTPLMKFVGDLVSYLVFLTMLLISIIRGADRAGIRVPNLNSGVDVCIWLWIFSYIVEEIKTMYIGGLKIYLKNWWILYRLIMNLTFLASFITRMLNVILSSDDGPAYKHVPRFLWPWNDPMLIAEGLYCVATVLAFVRILYVFQMSQVLGPLQLSLSRMIKDILQMFVIFFVIIFAFATGLTRLYIYYNDSQRIVEGEDTEEQQEAFTSWRASFKTLFWGMFGYGDVSYTDVIVDNTCGENGYNETIACYNATYHSFTEGTGYFLYALYHLIMITTLLNMLIGLMANTLTDIQENSDQEWKYARSSMWMLYFERNTFVPHPFSMLPNVQNLLNIGKWCLVKCKNDGVNQAKCSKDQCCYIEHEDTDVEKEKFKEKYKLIIKKLIIRYMHHLELEEDETPVTQNHLLQLKIDILKELHHRIPGASRPSSARSDKREKNVFDKIRESRP